MSNRMIRRARPDESDALTALTFRSKTHWGYPADVVEEWRPVLTVPSGVIETNPVYVMEAEGRLCGYYSLEHPDGGTICLESLFIEPDCIGSGVGKALWKHMLEQVMELGYQTVVFESDPNAEGFYLKMGTTRVGERAAPIPGEPNRVCPQMRFDLQQAQG